MACLLKSRKAGRVTMSAMPRGYIERRTKNPTSARDYEEAMEFYEK